MKEIIERFERAALGYPEKAGGDRRLIGYLCAYAPHEIFSVAGLQPCRLRAPGCSGTDMADTYMGRVTCSYTRCILEACDEDRFAALDGFVFTTGCDHMRRLHDNLVYLQDPGFVELLDVPHKASEAAVGWYVDELRRLVARLAEVFGVDTGPEALADSIRRGNRLRRLLGKVDETRRAENPPVSGGQMLALATGCGARPVAEAADDLQTLLDKIDDDEQVLETPRARLLVVSSQLDNPAYMRTLEASGGLVVGEIICTAASAWAELVDENNEPIEALARRYLGRLPCPRMMEEHSVLLARIRELYEERRADGVVLVSLKFCDTWGWENTLLSAELREAGIPVLRLEREYFMSGEGQIATRVQAFLESLGK